MTITTSRKALVRLLLVLLSLVTAGCMIEPYEGQHYPSRSTPIKFYGYVEVPNAPVRVYAHSWSNPASCGSGTGYWSQLATTTSGSNPIYDGNGHAWYGWQLTATVPMSSWCLAPGPEPGGLSYATNVTGIYRYHASQLGTKWRTLYTSYEDTVTCSFNQPSKSGFVMIGECSRINEPDWYAVQIWAE